MLAVNQAKENGKKMRKGPEAGGIEINVKDQKKAHVAGVRKSVEESSRKESEARVFDSNQIRQTLLLRLKDFCFILKNLGPRLVWLTRWNVHLRTVGPRV